MPAPVLSNELLRKKSMEAFLSAMKIDTTGIAIFSMEGVFSFTGENANQAEQLAAQLNTVVQKEGEAQQVRSISLADIIDSEIKNATCSDETNRGACQILFDYIIKVSGKNFSFSAESGVIELPLPHSNYAPMFNLLTYPHLTFDKSSSKLMLDIKKYLKDQKDIPESVIKVDGLDPTLSSTIFLNTSALESKKIFYATEELPNRTIKVTPYFFVPQAMTPPNYYFVLDVSDSMEKSLPDLKRAVSQLTTLLFDFQPNATVSITTFSNSLHHLGTYSKANDAQLKNAIARMRTENNTPLYEATAHFMEKITSSNVHNNVLLFTDGGETSSIAGSIDRINAIIKTLASELSLQIARNKFYVFSYGVPQGNLMHQVAETFLSKVISTSSADFLAAQQDPETMKKWAAARELFTARIVVSSTTENGAPKLNSYALDLSGQLQALDPSVCNSGDTIETTITDGNGQAVVHDSKTIGVAVVPTPQLSNAALMSTLGIAPAPLSNPASGVATNTTASNSAPATSADTTATPAPSNPSPLM